MKFKNGFLDIQRCVMFDKNKKKCTGLKELYCLTGECSFYKTKEMVSEQKRKIEKRREEMGL